MRHKPAPPERDGGAEAPPFIAPSVDGPARYAAIRRRLATPSPTTARPSRPSADGVGTAAAWPVRVVPRTVSTAITYSSASPETGTSTTSVGPKQPDASRLEAEQEYSSRSGSKLSAGLN